MFKELNELYAIEWKKKFAWFPRRCEISNKLIWLRYGYHGVIHDLPNWYYESEWHDINEHILWELRGRPQLADYLSTSNLPAVQAFYFTLDELNKRKLK